MPEKPTQEEIEASEKELDVEGHTAQEDQEDEQDTVTLTTGVCMGT